MRIPVVPGGDGRPTADFRRKTAEMILQPSFIMEKSIDILRQALAYPYYSRQVVDARALNLLHSTEMS